MKHSWISSVCIAMSLLFISCGEKETISSSYQSTNKVESLRIPRDVFYLSESDAIAVARLNETRSLRTKSVSSTNPVEGVIPIVDDSGNTLMYAINYCNNGGFALVSATKAFYPVIAEIERGRYSEEDANETLVAIIDTYKRQIQTLLNDDLQIPQSVVDSWRLFETREEMESSPETKSLAIQYDAALRPVIEQMTQQGYEWCLINCYPDEMPLEILNRFREGARTYTDPAFNWSETAVIFYKSTGYNEDYGPSFYCHWTPHDSYHNTSLAHERALCVSAVLTHYQYPSQYAADYDLYQMSGDVRSFIGTIKEALAESGGLENFLDDSGYSYVSGFYDGETVMSGIRNRHPSLCYVAHGLYSSPSNPGDMGENGEFESQSSSVSHFSLINGFRRRNQLYQYRLFVPQRSVSDHQLRMVEIANDASSFITPLTYYVTWGCGYLQGWFLASEACPVSHVGASSGSRGITTDICGALMSVCPSYNNE